MLIKFFGLFIQIKSAEQVPNYGILLANNIKETQAFNDASPYLPELPKPIEFFNKNNKNQNHFNDSFKDKLRKYLELGLYTNKAVIRPIKSNKKPNLVVIQSLPVK